MKAFLTQKALGHDNPLQSGEEPLTRKRMREALDDILGDTAGTVKCGSQLMYAFLVHGLMFVFGWARSLPIANHVFRMHVIALEPSLQADKSVALARRASRFVVFAMLVLTLSSACLFFALQAVMLYAVSAFMEMLANSMPDMMWILADVIKFVFSSATLFGALDPRHLRAHGVVLACMVIVCWVHAFVYLGEEDLLHGNLLRDRLLRAIIAVPMLVLCLYAIYAVQRFVVECF